MSSIQDHIKALRKDYSKEELHEHEVPSDPFLQFQDWFSIALEAKLPDANAFNLATVAENGKPSSRIVLLRNFDKDGFVFYTNYESQKGLELIANPFAAMNFFWPELEKQIRIEGTAAKISEQQSEIYFQSRPRESQIGAWSSPQSRELKNKAQLAEMVLGFAEKFKHAPIQKPPFWGGFCVVPVQFEFWQGRPGRLHDRLVYTENGTGNWTIKRLAP
jgi:pyridoxamine 5'-phosphate oxidase